MRWGEIDTKLEANDSDRGSKAAKKGEAEWLDEDATWKKNLSQSLFLFLVERPIHV
jgi:hypothetical protein